MPKILVGWNLAIYKLPRFNVFGSEWAFSAPTRRYPRTVIPSGVKKGRRLPEEVDPKTLSRPRAVKTDRKSFSFFLFSSLRGFLKFRFSFKVTKTTILMSYLFSSVPSYHKNAIFLKLQVDYARISFLLPHKTNVSVFSTAFENTFEIITGTSQPIWKPFVSRVHLIKKLGTLLVLGGLTREQKLYERV